MTKPKWQTVRCVVEYRTPSGMSEIALAEYVQGRLDTSESYHMLDSKMWAKGFNRVLARLEAARPKRLKAVIKSMDAALTRLRKL